MFLTNFVPNHYIDTFILHSTLAEANFKRITTISTLYWNVASDWCTPW